MEKTNNDEKSMLLTNLLQGNPNKHHHNFLLNRFLHFFPNIVEVVFGKRHKVENLNAEKDHCNQRLQNCDCDRTLKQLRGILSI